MPLLLRLQKSQGKVKENEKNEEVYLHHFSANQKIASSWGKIRFLPSCSTSNKLLLVARHIFTTDLEKCL